MDSSSSSYFPIIHLPTELKRRTASYLSPHDALRLSETCHNLHKSLSLRLLNDSRQLFTRQRFATNSDEDFPFVRIPCLSRRVHSITVTFRWRDQGWGNLKGQVTIIGSPRHEQLDPSLPFHGGRVVCTSSMAPHQEEQCKLTFLTSSMEGEMYQMWYRVGGGGGHQLLLQDGRVHTLLFDDEAGNFSRNYQILKNVRAIAVQPEAEVLSLTSSSPSFYPQLLLRVAMFIRLELAAALRVNNNKNKCLDGNHIVLEKNPLVTFLQMYNIQVTEESLSAVEEILQCESEEQAHSTTNYTPPAALAVEQQQGGGFLDDFRELFAGVAGMDLFPDNPAHAAQQQEPRPRRRRHVVRLRRQHPVHVEIQVQHMILDDDEDNENGDDDNDILMNAGDGREADP